MNNRSTRLAALALTSLLAFACQSNPLADRPGFESPSAAVDAVIGALRADDVNRLTAILGPESGDLVDTGNESDDRAGRDRFLELYDEKHSLELDGDEIAFLYVGELESPFPIPLIKSGGSWFLDTEEGREELIDRRIGRNELSTIQVCLALVDAQREYVAKDWDRDGVFEYAQRIRSTQGTKDGLFWETVDGEEISPVGEFFAAAEGAGSTSRQGDSYHGYRYRLLSSQGEHAPDGSYDYMAGEHMIGGFALVAFPARQGETGVMSFMVSHAGAVYQADLGPNGAAAADSMTGFDPGEGWSRVEEQ